jgi:hypothetical protein
LFCWVAQAGWRPVGTDRACAATVVTALRISKHEVQDLPPVDVDHPGASTGDKGSG